jgi:hypothetical protein
MVKYVKSSLITISRKQKVSGKLDDLWYVTRAENANTVTNRNRFDSFDEAVRTASLFLANGNDVYFENGKTHKWAIIRPEDFSGEILYGFDDDYVGAFPLTKEEFM